MGPGSYAIRLVSGSNLYIVWHELYRMEESTVLQRTLDEGVDKSQTPQVYQPQDDSLKEPLAPARPRKDYHTGEQ